MYNETKFREFNALLEDAKMGKVDIVVVAWPKVLGDDYEEIVENLSRLAEANLKLAIVGRIPGPEPGGNK